MGWVECMCIANARHEAYDIGRGAGIGLLRECIVNVVDERGRRCAGARHAKPGERYGSPILACP